MIKKKKVGGGAVPDDDPVCRISPIWKKKTGEGRWTRLSSTSVQDITVKESVSKK